MMNRMKMHTIVLAFLCTLFSSCCGIRLSEGGYRPRHLNFKLSKHKVTDAYRRIVDTNSIYITMSINQPTITHAVDTLYSFYRFFSGGQVYAGFTRPIFPSNYDINNLRSGLIGYCKVVGSKISLELFVDTDCGQYETQYGVVHGDSIVLSQVSSNVFWGLTRKNFRQPYAIHRTKEPWMKFWAQPDW